jgi:hypothetical protein
MGWGCGLPEPLGICVAGYPDTSLRPKLYVEPPLGERRGIPGLLAHRPRDTRAVHVEVWGRALTGRMPGEAHNRISGWSCLRTYNGC